MLAQCSMSGRRYGDFPPDIRLGGVGLRVRGLRVGYGVCGSGSESGVGEGEALEDRDSSGETGEFIVVEIRDA